MLQNIAQPGPEVIAPAVASRRGIASGKLRRFFLQNEAVDRPDKAQSEG
jgi:hypothetical protein